MPAAMAVDLEGALYVADPSLHRVRRIDPAEHTITTVAGSGQRCDSPIVGVRGRRASHNRRARRPERHVGRPERPVLDRRPERTGG